MSRARIVVFVFLFLLLLIPQCIAEIDLYSPSYMGMPCLIPVKGNRFRLCDDMVSVINGKSHVVPNGFETDLASIPRIMWPIFSPGDYDCIAASVLHDWHYCCSPAITRAEADNIFYYSLIYNGMTGVKAYVYWMAVRAFGGMNFKER